MFVMNVLSCSSVPVHIRNMASMYLFHSSMYGCPSHARIGSNDPMNKLAYVTRYEKIDHSRSNMILH